LPRARAAHAQAHLGRLRIRRDCRCLELARRRRRRRPGQARLYAPVEQEHLGEQSIAFIAFLESAGVLPPAMREMVIDRASAIPGGPLDLEDLKIIVLMVFWSLGEEPDALILDELFVAEEDRLIH
jgi:Smg protein